VLIGVVVVACFAGAVFQRLAGIGFSVVATPALALISGPRIGVALTNLLAVVVAVVVFAASGRRVDPTRTRIMILAGLIGVLPGSVLFRVLSPGPLQVVVGAITTLGLAAVLLAPRLRAQPRPAVTGCAGLVSGFSAAAAGAGGPALTVYAVATGWSQPEFAATGQLCYATQGAAALAIKGLPQIPVAWLGAAVAAVLGGLLAGHLAARRINGERARRAAIAIAGLAALATVAKGLLS